MIKRIVAITAILGMILMSGLQVSATSVPDINEIQPGRPIDDFGLLAPGQGWLLIDQRLYWTADNGASWNEITPPNISGLLISAIEFTDPANGWLALIGTAGGNEPEYYIARTQDGGISWDLRLQPLFDPGDLAAQAADISLTFLDTQTGWIVVKQASGSNFSLGSLFGTQDGGLTWRRLALPIGEPVVFSSPTKGWTAGGAAGDELYHTTDGGQNWAPVIIRSSQGIPLYQSPQFIDPQRGVLPVIINQDGQALVIFYLTNDGGQNWREAGSILGMGEIGSGTALPYAVFDENSWLAALPNSAQVWQVGNGGRSKELLSQGPAVAGIHRLEMASALEGWAASLSGSCPDGVSQAGCSLTSALLSTVDGGRTWSTLDLPTQGPPRTTLQAEEGQETPKTSDNPETPIGSADRTLTTTGQGFDRCEAPTLTQLQDWKTNGPYKAANLYIGGTWRACSNLGITASYLSSASSQGWTFIPTWVGPQSACYNSSSSKPRIPANTTDAYNLGSSEADAALVVAATLGLAHADKSGTVIYYDLEAFDVTNTGCVNSAKAFADGWSNRMRALGNLSGLYSTGSVIHTLYSSASRPDVIWPANWIYQAYNASATVWGVYGLPDAEWSNHQRIRQYAGGHTETWGATTMSVDSNVMDGVVADISCPESGGVILYREHNYSCGSGGSGVGFFQQTGPGWQNLPAGFDNTASSLRVPPGWSVRLYELPDLQGGSACLNSDSDFPPTDLFDNGTAIDENSSSLWVFEAPDCATYADLPASNPYYAEIEALDQAGYNLDCAANPKAFCPSDPLTHAEMALFVEQGRNLGDYLPPDPTAPGIFADIPVNSNQSLNPWYASWAQAMWKDELSDGCGTDPGSGKPNFCPQAAHTRAEAAYYFLLMQHGANYQPPPASGAIFNDISDPNAWYAPWVEQAWKQGLLPACAANLFCPNDLIPRDLAAHALFQAIGLSLAGGMANTPGSSGLAVLRYSSYHGGNQSDAAHGLALDASGNFILAGYSDSTSFPFGGSVPPGYGGRDALVTKFPATGGPPVFRAFLGGSRLDEAYDAVVDNSGDIYVVGVTDSPNFTTKSPNQAVLGGGRDAFIARFSSSGVLEWSTYLGGSDDDEAYRIWLDPYGVTVAGRTYSSNFPISGPYYQNQNAGGYDAFLARYSFTVNPPSLAYSTYLGGNGPDAIRDVQLDSSGAFYVTGDTGSANFPLFNPFQPAIGGGQDIFVTKIKNDGKTLIYSSYLGGAQGDWGRGLALDSANEAFLTGFTASSAFPLSNSLQNSFGGGAFDAFVTQLNVAGNSLVYSTYFGGANGDYGRSIQVDANRAAYLLGESASAGLVQSAYWPTNLAGSFDPFLVEIAAGGTRAGEGFYLGGSAGERAASLAIDLSGRLFLVGQTHSPNLPLANALQSSLGGKRDGFAIKLALDNRVFIPYVDGP